MSKEIDELKLYACPDCNWSWGPRDILNGKTCCRCPGGYWCWNGTTWIWNENMIRKMNMEVVGGTSIQNAKKMATQLAGDYETEVVFKHNGKSHTAKWDRSTRTVIYDGVKKGE